ncbi:hypothetical protein [Streptomyces virginiae]|uniref:hypothetical protein n=1 Tax=Streptomyces virginiae TaxID=1961 RepID=UPI002E283528|nr:hypothetical protein [Streptomyces virginiae]
MEILQWGVRALIVVAVLVGRHHYRYPGGWGPAFSRTYAPERRELAQARRRLTARAVQAWFQRTAVQLRLSSAQAAHRRRVTAAEQALREAQNPGSGPVVGDLGTLILHQHTLSIGEDEELPLAGLTVRIHHGSKSHHLIVTEADGHVHHVPLSQSEHEENAVHAFVTLITNAARRDAVFQACLEDRVKAAQAALTEAEGDTTQEDAVRTELHDITQQHQLDPEQAVALARLKAARQKWKDVTGRLPAR